MSTKLDLNQEKLFAMRLRRETLSSRQNETQDDEREDEEDEGDVRQVLC
jgi:hypothetical protein